VSQRSLAIRAGTTPARYAKGRTIALFLSGGVTP
jgi:hypothetical protein